MTEDERIHLFEWMQKSWVYEKSLEEEQDTQIFHARFNPDNQYIVKTNYNGNEEEHRTFKMGERYYKDSRSSLLDVYITSVEKLTLKNK